MVHISFHPFQSAQFEIHAGSIAIQYVHAEVAKLGSDLIEQLYNNIIKQMSSQNLFDFMPDSKPDYIPARRAFGMRKPLW